MMIRICFTKSEPDASVVMQSASNLQCGKFEVGNGCAAECETMNEYFLMVIMPDCACIKVFSVQLSLGEGRDYGRF